MCGAARPCTLFHGCGFPRGGRTIVESTNLISAYRALVINCALAGEIEEARLALHALRLVSDISLKSDGYGGPKGRKGHEAQTPSDS